ncbi:MAG: GFA family protein [Solirubrobacterales bacterium]
MPSVDRPLSGRCACGEVRFRVTKAFDSAGYCHCQRCQRRSGVPWSFNGLVAADGFELVSGADSITTWRPEDGGRPKSFCRACGGHVFGGDPDGGGTVAVRLGAVEGDPEVEPSWRAWLSSAPDWCPVPDDGLTRFEGGRPL